jgi:hypothetical protein
MSGASIVLSVDVDADADATFAAATDWPGHRNWMLGTTAKSVKGDGASVGSQIRAVTGVGPLGVADSMEITEWVPGRRCGVRHIGKVVRGTAMFAVSPRAGGGSTFTWSEQLDLPLGRVGSLGWYLVRPAFKAGLVYSLGRFARWAPTREASV